jgi:glutamyl-tRNA(Gln) amidotransferase subunit E
MSKIKSLSSLKNIDYAKVGLKGGVEIHQQLNTSKLFCSCPCKIVPNNYLNKEVERRLRFSLSETGEIDRAAYDEFRKGKLNIYRYNDEIACLVDLDEEPPKGPNKDALSVAIRVSQMLGLKFFDRLQFMRKLIIDGSVTSGYQRTAMLGLGGFLDTSFGKVEIDGVNLEEDACRVIERLDDRNIYSLDRQGIPLIEITTGPQIREPEQGFEVAQKIGNLLRSFSETKRGLGTIRQDLNVSIINGARVEIKGAQNLKMIPLIIEAEVKRQIVYLSILDELESRGVDSKNFSDFKIYDVSSVFNQSESKVILSNLKGKDSKVLAVKLNNFKDILGAVMQDDYRFATEICDRNKKHFPLVKGLFHLDELPNYGVTQKEVDGVKEKLGLDEKDSFIMLAGSKSVIENSLKNVLEIISELIIGVPSEVRQVDPKGTRTVFSRQMPGAARMYPETDIKDLDLDSDLLDLEREKIPELFDKKIKRLVNELNLDEGRVKDVLNYFNEVDFKKLLDLGIKSTVLYSTIFDVPKEVKKREGIEILDFDLSLTEQIVKLVVDNKLNKNSLYDLHVLLYKEKISNLDNLEAFLEDKGFLGEKVDESEIEEKIKQIVENNKGAPFGALMGFVMKDMGGKVDGKKVSEILKKYT